MPTRFAADLTFIQITSVSITKHSHFDMQVKLFVPAETAVLAKQELSNDVSLLEVLPRKVALHTSSHLTPTEA